MKFEEGLARVNEFAARHGGEPFEIAGDSRVRISVLTRGEVSLVLALSLSRTHPRSPAYLLSSLTFHCRRLSTTPIDEAFLESLEGVPPETASALIAFRKVMDGHVGFLLVADRPAGDNPFADAGPLSRWTAADLTDNLSRILAAAKQLGAGFEWPGSAEDFLGWARARMPALPGLAPMSQAWSVTPDG